MSAQPRAGLNLLLTAVLGLVVVVLVNYISSRHYKRWDWTSHGLFTLSERSQQALRELDQDVDIYVFLGRDEQDFADVETLLEEYKAVTDRIQVEWVDPDRDRARYQALADKFGIDSWLAGDVTLSQVPVVVTSGERKWKVERHQLIVEDFETFEDADGHKLDLQSERALTGAILEVTTGEPNKVCVATGHGEWEVGAYGERSFDPVARELEWEKIEVEPFEIRADEVPEACDALLRKYSCHRIARSGLRTLRRSQVLRVPSSLVVAKDLPSGEKAMSRMSAVWSVISASTFPLAVDQRITFLMPSRPLPRDAASSRSGERDQNSSRRLFLALVCRSTK